MTSRLTFPAPRRCTVASGQRSERITPKKSITIAVWADRAWTEADVRAALAAGAWFRKGYHDFDSVAAEEAALGARSRKQASIQDWLKRLSPEQLAILKSTLEKEAGDE